MKSLTKAKIQLIRSLDQKKYRVQHGLFVVEGDKTVREARLALTLAAQTAVGVALQLLGVHAPEKM